MTSHTKRSLRTNARHANVRQANGWEMDSQAIRNGTAEWMNGWRKCLNGWGRADKRMTKIFEWMQSNGWTAEEIFWATGCDVLSISRFDELEQIHGVRYVFNAFLRSRKAFAWSRKNYNTVLTLNFHIFHRTDYDGFLADFPVKTNLDWTAFKKNWLPRLQLA